MEHKTFFTMATNFLGMKKSTSSGTLNAAMAGDGFEFTLGPPESGFSLFLAERTKKVHFIRHAEVSRPLLLRRSLVSSPLSV